MSRELREVRGSHGREDIAGKCVPGREHSLCKGPETEPCLVSLSEEADMAGA